MPTVEVPAQLTVDHLIAAIKQLSPAEWQEFQRQLVEWQAQDGSHEETEEYLLARIRENSRLPDSEQQRLDRLRREGQVATLTPSEEGELQTLWRRAEQMTVTRLQALTRLAQRRNTNVRTLMRELEIPETPGVL